jgi:hypothetical protein
MTRGRWSPLSRVRPTIAGRVRVAARVLGFREPVQRGRTVRRGSTDKVSVVDLFAELTRIIEALDEAGIDYALCGGVALAVHGLPRATKDIDLLVRAADVEKLRAVAQRIGFAFEALPMTFSSSGITVRRFTKLSGTAPLMLDALIADGPLESVWHSRERLPYSGGSLWVVSRAGLISLKLAAARPQDLVDVQRLQELEDADG